MNTRPHKTELNIRQIALFGMLGALTFAAKVVMSGLPNIEPVSLMVMLFAVVFGWKGLYPTYLYVTMELLLYGIGFWNINYVYVWAVLFVAAYAMRRLKNPLWWAMLAGLFGLLFGLLCAPVYGIFFGSIQYALRWWVTGFPFDILHCIGNFAIALVLFVPLRMLTEKLWKRIS